MTTESSASQQNPDAARRDLDHRLAMARDAFERYYSRCFWYLDRSLQVTEDQLPRIADGLRRHGDREAFRIASEICR